MLPSTPALTATKRLENYGYKLKKRIADGGFGKVFDVVHTGTGKCYAVKQISKMRLSANMVYQITSERYYLYRLRNHPLFVNMVDCRDDNEFAITVMDYAEKGDIDTYIQKYQLVDAEIARYFTIQIICAVSYLHRNNIIHRDLKPQNILIKADYNIAICDFMTAAPIKAAAYREEMRSWSGVPDAPPQSAMGSIYPPPLEEMRGHKFVGTAIYMSPEVAKSRKSPGILENKIRRDERIRQGLDQDTIDDMEQTTASDIWSIGCILYFMMTGHPPFLLPHIKSDQSSIRNRGGLSMGDTYTPMRAISPVDDHEQILVPPAASSMIVRISPPEAGIHPNMLPSTVKHEIVVPSPGSFPHRNHYDTFPQLGFYDTNTHLQAKGMPFLLFSEFTKTQLASKNHMLPPSVNQRVSQVLDVMLHPIHENRVQLEELLKYDLFSKGDSNAPAVENWSVEHILSKQSKWPSNHVGPFIPEFPPSTTPPKIAQPPQPAKDPWTNENVWETKLEKEKDKNAGNPVSSGSGSKEPKTPRTTPQKPGPEGQVPTMYTPTGQPYIIVGTYARPGDTSSPGSPPKVPLALPPPMLYPKPIEQVPLTVTYPEPLWHHPDKGLTNWWDPKMAAEYKRQQRNSDGLDKKWDIVLGDDEIIIKMGVMRKRRGYYSIKTRMFLLTYSPSQQNNKTKGIRFSYYDIAKFDKYGWDKNLPPQKRCYKGEIMLTSQVKERHVTSYADFKYWTIETPGRVYYLIDKNRGASTWKNKVDEVMRNRYGADSYNDYT